METFNQAVLEALVDKTMQENNSTIEILDKTYTVKGNYAQVLFNPIPTINYNMFEKLEKIAETNNENEITQAVFSLLLLNENFIRESKNGFKLNYNPMSELQIKKSMSNFIKSGEIKTTMPQAHYFLGKTDKTEEIFRDLQRSNRLYSQILSDNINTAKRESANMVNGYAIDKYKILPLNMTHYLNRVANY